MSKTEQFKLQRTESTWPVMNVEPVRECEATAAVMINKFAYVKYLHTCTNNGKKHSEKEIISVERFHKVLPRDLQLKTRSYRIKCGENNNLCRGTISLLGESIQDIEKIVKSKRVVFPPSRTLQTGTEASSAAEDLADKRKRSTANITAQEKLLTLADQKLAALNANYAVKSKTANTHRRRTNAQTRLLGDPEDSDLAEEHAINVHVNNARDSGVASSSDDIRRNIKRRLPVNTMTKSKEKSENQKLKNVSSTVVSNKPLTLRGQSVNIQKDNSTVRHHEYVAQSSEDCLVNTSQSRKPRTATKSSNIKMRSSEGTISTESGKGKCTVRDTKVLQSLDDKRSARLASPLIAKPVVNTESHSRSTRNSAQKNIPPGNSKKQLYKMRESTGSSTENTVHDHAHQSSDGYFADSRPPKTASRKSVPRKKKIGLPCASSDNWSSTDTQSMNSEANVGGAYAAWLAHCDSRGRTTGSGKLCAVSNEDTKGSPEESDTLTKDDFEENPFDAGEPSSQPVSRDGSPLPSRRSPYSDTASTIVTQATREYEGLSSERFDNTFRSDFNELTRMLNEGEGEEPAERIVSKGNTLEITAVIRRLKLENRVLRSLNLELQRNNAVNSDKISATIEKVDLESRLKIKQRIATGGDLPVGTVDETKGMIHAGYGKWISFVDYSKYCNKEVIKKVSASKFMANMARLIFTDEVLSNSSVTGTQSNAHKDKPIKPRLDPVGMDAVAAITRYWMRMQGMSEGLMVQELSKLATVLAKKIADLNRPSRDAARNRKKKAVAVKHSRRDVNDDCLDEPDDIVQSENENARDTDSDETESDVEEVVEASEMSTDGENESQSQELPNTAERNPTKPGESTLKINTHTKPEDSCCEELDENSPDKKLQSSQPCVPALAPLANNHAEYVPKSHDNTEMIVDANEDVPDHLQGDNKIRKKHPISSDEEDTTAKRRKKQMIVYEGAADIEESAAVHLQHDELINSGTT